MEWKIVTVHRYMQEILRVRVHPDDAQELSDALTALWDGEAYVGIEGQYDEV